MVRSNINKWLYVCLVFYCRCCCCCCCLFAIYCFFDIKTNKLHTPTDMANFKRKWEKSETEWNKKRQLSAHINIVFVWYILNCMSEIFHFLMGFVSMSGVACVVCWYGRFWQLFNFSHSMPLWLFPYFTISFLSKNPKSSEFVKRWKSVSRQHRTTNKYKTNKKKCYN